VWSQSTQTCKSTGMQLKGRVTVQSAFNEVNTEEPVSLMILQLKVMETHEPL
jgi:hypothetical protein